jgi:hypothetical protein
VTGLPTVAEKALRRRLEEAKRLTALQVDTLTHAVDSIDDEVGWDRLTELGTSSTVRAQDTAISATVDALNATLEAAGTVGDIKDLTDLIKPGRLGSGETVRGMFAMTRDVVTNRMTGGATFPEALDASANKLVSFAASEPHRISRDGQFAVGLEDERFNRYRRVAHGATCAFCLMLATRGAVYLTPGSAGQGRKYHRMCDCTVEMVVDENAVARSRRKSTDLGPRPFEQRPTAPPTDLAAQQAAERAAREAADAAQEAAERSAREAAEQAATQAPVPAARFDADTAQRLSNADLEREMTEAWDRADDNLATLLEDEMERRNKWAQAWGRSYDEYDDWRPLDPTGLDDADLPAFDDIPQQKLTRAQVKAEWEAEQEVRFFDAEAYGGGIRPDLAEEARKKGITLSTLMTGDPRTAYKFANPELLQWWDMNGGRRPLWEQMAAYGHLDKRTSLAQLKLTESKAKALAQELIGKDWKEARKARVAAQGKARREAERKAGGRTASDDLAAAQRRYRRAQKMAADTTPPPTVVSDAVPTEVLTPPAPPAVVRRAAKAIEDLTPDEAVRVYAWGGSGIQNGLEVNGNLRARFGQVEGLDPRHRALITKLDQKFAATPGNTDQMLTTHRAIYDDDTVNRFRRLRPGDQFVDNGYVSTTRDAGILDDFASPGERLDFRIRVAKGTKVVDVDQTLADLGDSSYAQRELLLDRGTRFEVTAVGTGPDGQPRLDLIALPRETPIESFAAKAPRTPKYVLDDLLEQGSELPDDIASAVEDYASSGSFAQINAELRGIQIGGSSVDDFADFLAGAGEDAAAAAGYVAQEVKLLDQAVARSRFMSEGTVYRGIDGKALGDLKVGKVITDPAYLSTSHDAAYAASWPGDTVMKIKVPAGQRALLVDAAVPGMGQGEILLPRGTSLKITKIQQIGDKRVVSATIRRS